MESPFTLYNIFGNFQGGMEWDDLIIPPLPPILPKMDTNRDNANNK
jgi:hypothetical protein